MAYKRKKLSRQQKRRIKKQLTQRDGNLCGIHLGGCHKPLVNQQEAIDHITPISLFGYISPNPAKFDSIWNYQLMHEECNRGKSDGLEGRELDQQETAVTTGNNAPDDWPRFECKCHYLQILEGAMYVCTTSMSDSGRYELCTNVVMDFGKVNRQDAIMVPHKWIDRGGTEYSGYRNEINKQDGYILPSFAPNRVPGFNIFERSRVGLPTPDRIYIDEKGYVTPILQHAPRHQ